jgi:hypothetical protein
MIEKIQGFCWMVFFYFKKGKNYVIIETKYFLKMNETQTQFTYLGKL